MSVGIFFVGEVIIVNQIVLPSVVRAIYVDNANLPLMRVLKNRKDVQIVPFDKKVLGAPPMRLSFWFYPRSNEEYQIGAFGRIRRGTA